MATVQDLMSYQINKFHRTTTLHPPKPAAPVAAPSPPAPVSQSKSQPPSPTIKASTPTDQSNSNNKLKTVSSCKCQSARKCGGDGHSSAEGGSLELIQYYYCPDCERESKKSRTLRFGSGGEVIVDKSHHTYYNTIHPPPPAIPPKPSEPATTDSSKTSADSKSCDSTITNPYPVQSPVHANINAKNDESSGSTFTISINLPKTFDFNLLANQSDNLRVSINITETKNSKRALASLPSSPSAISRAGNGSGSGSGSGSATSGSSSSLSSSHSFTFTNGVVHTSSSCGHLNNVCIDGSSSSDWSNSSSTSMNKPDIRHNLHLSGWYFGKMDWQDSIRVLKSTPVGTFLLRDSGDRNYAFSLSMQTEHGPISSRISYRNGKFRLDSQDHVSELLPCFTSVISLVEHYIKFGLVKNPSGRQVWVDSRGETFSPIHLKEPKKKFVPSLQHLSRLAINKSLDRIDISRSNVPPTIQNYLNKYPHTV